MVWIPLATAAQDQEIPPGIADLPDFIHMLINTRDSL